MAPFRAFWNSPGVQRLLIFGGLLANWGFVAAERVSKGDISYLIDPRLKMQFDANSVRKVVDIAMKCAAANSTQRQTMAGIVVQLKEALELEANQERDQNLSMEYLGIDIGGKMSVTDPIAR